MSFSDDGSVSGPEPPSFEALRSFAEGTTSTEHADIAAFEASPADHGMHTIWHGGLPLDLSFVHGSRRSLVVVFDGALERSTTRLPRFSGGGVTAGLGNSRLSFSDPSLYCSDRLRLGWYAGNLHQPDLQDTILRTIRRCTTAARPERVILFGASGGGFAALYFSSLLPGSLAVVMNPQTDIAAYLPGPVRVWRDTCWAGEELPTLPSTVTTNLVRHYSARPVHNHVAYLQNRTDSHVDAHMRPWLGAADPERVQVMMGDWGQGHVAPPKDVIQRVLRTAMDWSPGTILPGFAPAG